jgi:hypothetical protein
VNLLIKKGFANKKLLMVFSSLSVARLSSVAAICAQSVYQPLIPPQDPSYSIKVLFSIGASVSGDVKATTLYLVQSLGNTSDGSESRSILVVSVRGSAGLVDWIVNTNTHEEDALKIIVRFVSLIRM